MFHQDFTLKSFESALTESAGEEAVQKAKDIAAELLEGFLEGADTESTDAQSQP